MRSVLSLWLFYSLCIFNVRNVLGKKVEFNTFPVEYSRATMFVPQVRSKICFLKPDIGPCRGKITMYFYDPDAKSCSTFNWGGCQGNGNRFDSFEDCMGTCVSKPGQLRPRPKWCSLRFDYGFCFGALERWYYDNIWKVCKKTIYSGCGGNKNNFYNLEQCEAICRFGHGPIKTTAKSKDGLRKVVIINPWDTTPNRGKLQSQASTKKVT